MGTIAWKFKISLVSSGLQYQVEDTILSLCSMHISNNGSLPFYSTSNINFKFGCHEGEEAEGACRSPEYNLSGVSCMASLTGTFVYSDVTSNEMITLSGSRVVLFKLSTVFWVELFIFDSGTTDNHSVTFWAILW